MSARCEGNSTARRWPGVPADGQYGANNATPAGYLANPSYCLAEVWSRDGWRAYQCNRKPVGDDGLCKQHHMQALRWLEQTSGRMVIGG
jgi:hypothetical protein